MNKKKVTVIDYGVGNLFSIQRSIEVSGECEVILAKNLEQIYKASHLILPGVGSFQKGMNKLEESGLVQAIIEKCEQGTPILGICLGMQLLFDKSEEFGSHAGLGLVEGEVLPITRLDGEGKVVRRVPHVGWKTLSNISYQDWDLSCLHDNNLKDSFYFTHSFMVMPNDEKNVIATCEYQKLKINAVIKKDNITGVQFHPEKSGEAGLKILKSFIVS